MWHRIDDPDNPPPKDGTVKEYTIKAGQLLDWQPIPVTLNGCVSRALVDILVVERDGKRTVRPLRQEDNGKTLIEMRPAHFKAAVDQCPPILLCASAPPPTEATP